MKASTDLTVPGGTECGPPGPAVAGARDPGAAGHRHVAEVRQAARHVHRLVLGCDALVIEVQPEGGGHAWRWRRKVSFKKIRYSSLS